MLSEVACSIIKLKASHKVDRLLVSNGDQGVGGSCRKAIRMRLESHWCIGESEDETVDLFQEARRLLQ